MTEIDLAALKAPFPPDRISWRVGSTSADKKRGMALAYIDARDVMERLDEVCGPARWQCRYPHANGKTVCEIGIKIGDEWVWKADGAGDTDVEKEKGALSDALKRAAVRWGIGRYLYDIASPWVELEPAGRSYKIPDRELARLNALLGGRPQRNPQSDGKPAKTTPDAWVRQQQAAIEKMLLADDVTAWEKANERPLVKLSKDSPELAKEFFEWRVEQMRNKNPLAA